MTPSEVNQLTPDGYGGDFEPTTQEVQPDINLSDYTLEPFYEQNVLRGYLLKLKRKETRNAKAN